MAELKRDTPAARRNDSPRTWVTRAALSNREGRSRASWRRDFAAVGRARVQLI